MNMSDVKRIKNKISNSIKPSIEESERFILFLNKRFNLNLPDNLIVNIQETRKNTKGFFMPKEHSKGFENTTQSLNTICISSNYLKDTPYETLTHETAHFYNHINGIKDCTKNQYHNKHFKEMAEKLLLDVERDKNRGYAYTSKSKEFEKMLKEFKPNKKAFHIFQKVKKKGKSPNRNILYMCDCGVKVRTAFKPFKAVCQHCNSEFKQK